MPLFFFHLRDQDYLHEDEEGTDLQDLHAALEEALHANREFADEQVGVYGLEFEITDSSGRTVLKVPIQERRRNPDLAAQPRADGEERRSSAAGKPRHLH